MDHTGATNAPDPNALDVLWAVMQAEKGDLETRSEEYARWTIPYLCAGDNTANAEQDKADVAIGPRLVNHLSNKVVDAMFPKNRPFFTVALTPDVRRKLRKEMGEENEAAFAAAVLKETASVEEAAMRKLGLVLYRPQAIEAVKHQIVTGNAIIRRMPNGRRVVYGVKHFCVRRTIDGAMHELILKDAKNFGSLSAADQATVRTAYPHLTDKSPCILYSHYKFNGTRWKYQQSINGCMLRTNQMFKPVDLPVLSLVWNLARGENYGRGLVEDHTTAFHQIDVLTRALVDMCGIMADIKFLVDPASTLDVETLNSSSRGSYHSGREGDISTPANQRNLEIGALDSVIKALERELAQAFLLNSASVRDAERVTAAEIRFLAMELESAFGGLYSRLALEWQQLEAEYAVSLIDFNTDLGSSALKAFEVVVTTGLESLSREGQLDSLRNALADLQMLDTVPEVLQSVIDPQKFATFIFTNHNVKWQEFLYSKEELAANQQAAMDQEQKLMDMQTGAKVAQAAGSAAMQEQPQGA